MQRGWDCDGLALGDPVIPRPSARDLALNVTWKICSADWLDKATAMDLRASKRAVLA